MVRIGAVVLSTPPEIRASSNGWGWSSLYTSLQRELPFEDTFKAVDDQMIVLHLDGPITVHRRVQNGESSRLIPPGGLFMIPGGMDFGVRLGGTLLTLHLYLRRAVIEDVSQSLQPGDPTKWSCCPGLAKVTRSSSVSCWAFVTRCVMRPLGRALRRLPGSCNRRPPYPRARLVLSGRSCPCHARP